MFKFKCLQGRDRWTLLLILGAILCILAFPAQWLSHDGKASEKRGSSTGGFADITAAPKDLRPGESHQTELENRVKSILEHVEGIGAVEVMIIQEENKRSSGLFENDMDRTPPITGMVICADGGGSPHVQAEICEAMEALFGLPAHKIKVLKRVE